jgi:hypothetical protein
MRTCTLSGFLAPWEVAVDFKLLPGAESKLRCTSNIHTLASYMKTITYVWVSLRNAMKAKQSEAPYVWISLGNLMKQTYYHWHPSQLFNRPLFIPTTGTGCPRHRSSVGVKWLHDSSGIGCHHRLRCSDSVSLRLRVALLSIFHSLHVLPSVMAGELSRNHDDS